MDNLTKASMAAYLVSPRFAYKSLRRCWYEALKSRPCLPTTDAALTSVVGTLNTSYAAYQQRRKEDCLSMIAGDGAGVTI